MIMTSRGVSEKCSLLKLADNSSNNDNISKLPDAVLHHILSLLPSAKDVVNTSLLSKRWENLWAFVPTLHFSDEDFKDKKKFKHFVDSFLMLRGVSVVHTFSLKVRNRKKSGWNHYINRWIQYAIRNNDKVLHIIIDHYWVTRLTRHPGKLDLSGPSFTCQSLEELSLKCVFEKIVLRAPKLISLSKLKKIHLSGLVICDDLDITSICPLLEDLCLENCEHENLELSSQTLMKLRVVRCRGQQFRICSSNLKSFELDHRNDNYGNNLVSNLVLEGLSSLESASIYCCDYFDGISFQGLSYVKSLNCCDMIFEELSEHDFSHFQTFYNLKSLKLGCWEMCESGLRSLARFLGFTPNLESLTLYFVKEDSGHYDEQPINWETMDISFNCPCLRFVELKNSRECAPKLAMFLLKNAKSIEKMSFTDDRN